MGVELKGFDKLIRAFGGLDKSINSKGYDETVKATRRIKTEAVVNVMSRSKNPTGALASSIQAMTINDNNSIVGRVVTGISYGVYVENRQHFMSDAFNNQKRKWIKNIASGIKLKK